MRMGSWNVVMFVSFEQLKGLSAQYKEYKAQAKLPMPFGAIVNAQETERSSERAPKTERSAD